jgi:uncharacterized protein YlxP (DUF503 family)
MSIGLLSVDLFLPGASSLKDKRMVLRRLKDRLRGSNVSIAEVAHQDLWQRAGLAVVAVASDKSVVERMLESALSEIERLEPDAVTRAEVEYLN